MPDTAQAQVPRLVELVAWLSQSDSAKPVTYRAAARHLGVAEQTLRRDLDVLFGLSDEHRDWLASLRVAVVAQGFAASSRGPFRRPLHFSGAPSEELEQALAVARRARDESKKLEILYCASGGEPSRRVVHVHQIVEAAGRWYVVAWCEKVGAFRNFRADRLLEARLLEREFRPQVLFKPVRKPEELLRAEEVVMAKVAFSPRIARWLKERYRDGREGVDGRYVVTFRVADPAWFVREVLQYGAEAEVLEPEGMREAVRRAVA